MSSPASTSASDGSVPLREHIEALMEKERTCAVEIREADDRRRVEADALRAEALVLAREVEMWRSKKEGDERYATQNDLRDLAGEVKALGGSFLEFAASQQGKTKGLSQAGVILATSIPIVLSVVALIITNLTVG